MKVIESKNVKNAKVTLVCCLHGDEIFGKKVFDYYQKQINDFPGLRLVLANEQAFKKGARFIDSDLNRSFPGKTNGGHEEKLAIGILKLTENDEYVIDIHTTTADIKVTPIITAFTPKTKRILNLSTSREIVSMDKKQARHSLIGNVKTGVSFEFGEKFASTKAALEEVSLIVSGLLNGYSIVPIARQIFHITGKIPSDFLLLDSAQNFQKVDFLGYPFLLGEKSYKEYQGFFAEKFIVRKI